MTDDNADIRRLPVDIGHGQCFLVGTWPQVKGLYNEVYMFCVYSDEDWERVHEQFLLSEKDNHVSEAL